MLLTPRYDGPPVMSIDGRPDDQLDVLVRQRRRLQSLLGDLAIHDWNRASRCDAWTVADVVSHLIGVNRFWESSLAAGIAGTPTRILAHFDPAATPPLMVDAMRGVSTSELLEQFAASSDALLDTVAELDDQGWEMLAESPPGHVPIRLVMNHALWDAWVHERDIALPLGLIPVAEPDEVRSCLRYAAAVSPALAIGAGRGIRGVFALEATEPELRFTLMVGDSVAVTDAAPPPDTPCVRGSAVALIEALSMRAPLPHSTPSEWRQLLGGLAAAFDAEVASN